MLALIRRLGFTVVTLFIVVTLTFFLIRIAPGDPLHTWAMEFVAQYGMTYEQAYQVVSRMYGYNPNEPLLTQYVNYLGGLVKGDLGHSFLYKVPVWEIIVKALPYTVFLLSTSLVLSFSFGILLGMLAAWYRKRIFDPLVNTYASLTGATPDYITALLLLIVFAVNLKLFPTKGAYESGLTPGFNWPFIKSLLHHSALPIAATVFENAGAWAVAMKGSAVSVLGEDFVTAAKARGLHERRIMVWYVGRNAILPMVTGLAIAFGTMLGGNTLIETIFNYPGIGWFFGQALGRRDYGLMQGLFLLTAAGVILANFLADILYSFLDPRIRLEE